MEAFSDAQAVAGYLEGPPRLVPGFADMQRMVALLLAERAPNDARILVLGAGGGLEIKAFAESRPGWQFDGVDPSAEMLGLARTVLGPIMARTQLHHGLIDCAPEGPFDAATCILTLHFVEREERLRTLREIRRRLKPGAPFAVAHFSFPQGAGERERWLARYAAFAVSSGLEPSRVETARSAIATRFPVLAPEEDEQHLRDAGFSGISLFYVGFAFRGWVAYA
jgi:tRNA (cmo5U34)-methyltransferase